MHLFIIKAAIAAMATSALAMPQAELAPRMSEAAEKAFKFMQAHQLVFHPLAVVLGRIDPIVSPGVELASGHVHTIVGPSNINSNSTFESLRDANCTSLNLGNRIDLSGYWQPSFYHRNSQGELSLLNLTSTSVYYNMGYNISKVVPFPDGFKMTVGNVTKDPMRGPSNGYITSDFGDTGEIPRAYTSWIGMHVEFPDCHDGKPFTFMDQNEHMTYSYHSNCPDGWRKYPQIMLQFSYSTGSETDYPANPPDQPTYVLADGDTEGSSLHGDFYNGWQTGMLEKVIEQCSDLGFGNTANCPVFKDFLGEEFDQAAAACRYDQKIPDEAVGLTRPVAQLPGYNTLTNVTAPGSTMKLKPSKFTSPKSFDTSARAGGWPLA